METSSGSQPSACSKQLVAKLRSCESRLDALQVEAAASSVAGAEFASEVTQRLSSLEAEIQRLSSSSSCALDTRSGSAIASNLTDAKLSDAACHSTEELLTKAASSLLEDVKGCTQRLLTSVGHDVSQAIEAGKLAAIATAERAAAEHAARAVAEISQQLSATNPALTDIMDSRYMSITRSNAHDVSDYTKSPQRLLEEARHASIQASAAEERIAARIAQCVNLIDVACSPANRPGLEALRDVVESLETVSARVSVIEHSMTMTLSTSSVDAPLAPSLNSVHLSGSSPTSRSHARLNARLEKVERNLPTMHDRLHECLLVLWTAVKEISRELCNTGRTPGDGSGLAALHSGKALKNSKRSLSPQRSPRRGSTVESRNMSTPMPAF